MFIDRYVVNKSIHIKTIRDSNKSLNSKWKQLFSFIFKVPFIEYTTLNMTTQVHDEHNQYQWT